MPRLDHAAPCTTSYLLIKKQVQPLTCASNLSSFRYSRKSRKHWQVSNALGEQRAAEMRVYEANKLRGPLDTQDLVFYTHTLCPYAQRVWLTLLEKRVDFSMVHVDLADKPGWYSRINPNGLVPAVTFDGYVTTESIDICRWLDKNQPGKSLVPSDSALQEVMEQVVKQVTPGVVSAGLAYLAGSSGRSWGIGTGQRDGQKKTFLQKLQGLDQALEASGGPYLAGPSVSLADVVVWPFMCRFSIAMQGLCTLDIQAEATPRVRAWMDSMAQQAACRESDPDPALFLKALRKERSLDFFDYSSYGVAALHPWLSEGVHLLQMA